MSENNPDFVSIAVEILKPISSFIQWAIAIKAIYVKIHEIMRWAAEERKRPKKENQLADINQKVGEIRGLTWRYRRRKRRFYRNNIIADMRRINRITSELASKVKDLTRKSLLEVLKDPPQPLPELPSDEILQEIPLLELVIKEEMKNIGNVAYRIKREIMKL